MTKRSRAGHETPGPRATLATLYGRTRDLRAIRGLLRAGPTTIVGSPGVGKTAIATEIARAGRGIVCALAGVATVDALLAALGLAVGQPTVAPESSDVQLDLIVSAVRQRRIALLVLDNVDQLIPDGLEEIERLAKLLSSIRVLATSREPLNIPREQVYRLGPLRAADAAALFEARVHAVGARRIDARDEPAVRALVQRLDGIPLAVEFAAGLARQYAPRGLLRLFKDDAWLGRERNLVRHDDVLQRSFTASWERLSDVERLALRECAVFEAGFVLDDAEALLTPPRDGQRVPDVLASLVRKSLVSTPAAGATERAGEFWLLSTVRQLVQQFTPVGFDSVGISRRRAESLVSRLTVNEYDPYRDPTDAERADVRRQRADCVAAIDDLERFRPADAARLALRVCLILEREGPHELHLALLKKAASRADALSALERVGAYAALALALRWHTRLAEAEDVARMAVDVADASGDARARARAYETISDVLIWRGRRDESLDFAERSIELAMRAGDRGAEGYSRTYASVAYRTRRNIPLAELHAVRAIELCAEHGCSRGLAGALLALGTIRFEANETDAAEALFLRAREVFVVKFDRRRESYVLNLLASLEIARGRDEPALAYLREASRSRKLLDDGPVAPFVRLNLAVLLLRGEHLAEARAELTDAIAALRGRGHGEHLAIATGFMAALEVASGDLNRAREAMTEAEKILPTTATRGRADLELLRGVVWCAESREAHLAGQSEEAQRLLAAARALVDAAPGATLPAHPVTRKLLERAIERSTPPFSSLRITVAGDGSWFVGTDGVRRSLARRQLLRKLLMALVRAHRRSPLGVDELKSAGWPGERMLARSASSRVWVAVSTLRSLGLADVIVRAEQGYLIAPHIEVETVIHASKLHRARETPPVA